MSRLLEFIDNLDAPSPPKTFVPLALNPQGLNIILQGKMKEYLNIAGIENKNFAGHSLRSGFATVAAESGADERSIMAMTGHKSTQMVRRYIREANIFKNNALNKINI